MRSAMWLFLGVILAALVMLPYGMAHADCVYPSATSEEIAEVIANSNDIYYGEWGAYSSGVYDCAEGGGANYYMDASSFGYAAREIMVYPDYAGTCAVTPDAKLKGRSRVVKILDTVCYVLAPPEPDHCHNGIKDGDEEGVNCGGSCNNTCDSLACPDTTNWFVDSYGRCYPTETGFANLYATPDSAGNCPAGFTADTWHDSVLNQDFKRCKDTRMIRRADGSCADGWIPNPGVPDQCLPEPVAYSSANDPPDVPDVPIKEGWTGTAESTTENKTVDIVDNGDGTSTKTETTVNNTTNNNDNSTTTTTTTTTSIIDNSTNEVLSSSSESETTGDKKEDNAGNYDWNIGGPDYNGVAYGDDDKPAEEDTEGLISAWINNNPVRTFLTGYEVTCTAPISSVSTTIFGKTVSIDFARQADNFATIGDVWLVLCGFLAVLIVFM